MVQEVFLDRVPQQAKSRLRGSFDLELTVRPDVGPRNNLRVDYSE